MIELEHLLFKIPNKKIHHLSIAVHIIKTDYKHYVPATDKKIHQRKYNDKEILHSHLHFNITDNILYATK